MLAANEKDDTIFAEHGEETFEFSAVRQLPDGRVLSNVQNHSHDDGEAHIYPVFFDVAQDGLIFGAHVAECGCPADEYHDDECKHREAASECGELLAEVLDAALGDNADSGQDADAGAEQTDGGEAVADGGRLGPSVGDTVDHDGQRWTVRSVMRPLLDVDDTEPTVALHRGGQRRRVELGNLTEGDR